MKRSGGERRAAAAGVVPGGLRSCTGEFRFARLNGREEGVARRRRKRVDFRPGFCQNPATDTKLPAAEPDSGEAYSAGGLYRDRPAWAGL